ncbi:CCA tRNA nucleotidyltransferase [Periweissella ghanensis]|uniref:CCA-adding enzyme n=1 Tax=Periweissella ghanensis TaxID=467997 RepID=A0ABN8BJ79_9LACO|nr:CCA tRNA nucleotidyltransferase [Periweissella ghanensis]MCM0600813.1 CCA tRNA nucleotidyltransferase [Periweissella ghanensis]CAH0417771.1 CCA-adding enzyme [Periweissella ghanensis]
MKIANLPQEFTAALPILETITNAGFEAYFVGGSVRDMLLGKAIHDVDIATSAYPSEIKALFNKTVDTGIEHGTVMILDHGNGYETTTFRTETGYTDFRRPDSVSFVRDLAEDLKRRDFTINALAMRANGEIVDLFNGLEDLDKHIIRAVGDPVERFHEDALRMMRALRFSAQLGFVIEAATNEAIKGEAHLLVNIAVERINVELSKLLLGKAVAEGLMAFAQSGLYKYVPNIDMGRELDIVAAGLKLQGQILPDDATAWTYLIDQLGLSEDDAGSFLKAWKHSNDFIKQVKTAYHFIQLYRQQVTITKWELYQVGAALPIALAVLGLNFKSFDGDKYLTAYHSLVITNKRQLAIDGQQLIAAGVVKPGPKMGKILAKIEHAVVIGQLKNHLSDLLAYAEMLQSKGE